mmetsp:Transcript_77608/g.179980  ORF Transcript_77608/g.179980 Transcript_77608/m.179980 type:complete len:207 (+) Transcript_77608:250-870(+)
MTPADRGEAAVIAAQAEGSRSTCLPLHHRDGLQLDGLLGDSCVVAGLHHLSDVLVALRRLLHDQLWRGHTNGDAHVLQALQHVPVLQVVARLVAAQRPASPVASAAKGLHHPLISAREHVGAGAHGTPDDDRLARELVVHRDEWVMRRERPCGALSMNQQLQASPVNHVFLDLGNVVRDVVDDVHVQVLRRLVEHFGKSLASEECH